jgi:hypothetical protein
VDVVRLCNARICLCGCVLIGQFMQHFYSGERMRAEYTGCNTVLTKVLRYGYADILL